MKELKQILLKAVGVFLVLGLTGCGLENSTNKESANKESPSQQISESDTIKPEKEKTVADGLQREVGTEQEILLATVVELEEQSVIVKVEKEEWGTENRVRIGKNEVVSEEGMPKLLFGDLIQIFYNLCVKETYPAQLGTIFAVYRQEEQESDIKTVENSRQYASIKLQLPSDWDYEMIPAEHEKPNQTDTVSNFGICFFPAQETEMRLELVYWADNFGICGTGVTEEEVDFENGMKARQYTETIEGNLWITLVYQDLPGTYVLSGGIPEELWEKYQPAVMEILGQAEFGTGKE